MPRLIPALLTATASLVALAGCAPTASNPTAASTSAAQRQCLFQNDVQSFRVRSSDQTVFVRGIGKAVFELQVSGACRDMDHAMGMAFWPQRGLDRLCTGDTTQIVFSGGTPPATPCHARIVKKLSEAEVAALPDRDRP
ncbi:MULTISPECIES: DUF6491 family protein [unclassified Brevundimonas]|uniref:DUF6491 family protein n=1 Tax=unclassified Brevundimonas TaxID=2622653 RepID=UPI0025C3B45F|nr:MULTISPECIES: DUF6491 family protein [unclassified Brevundimonas]